MTLIGKISVFVLISFTITTSKNIGLEDFLRAPNVSDAFRHLLRSQFPSVFKKGMENVYDMPTVCYMCNLVVDLVILERRLGLSEHTLAEEATLICKDMNIQPERVCKGIIDLDVGIFVYIIDNYANLTSNRVCGSVLQSSGCPPGNAFNWSIDVAPGVSPERPKLNATAENLKILHLSDVHYDPQYTPGGNANCGEPICCQPDQGEPATPEESCGYWSDPRDGDTSWHLITETIRQAKTQNIDYVYFTGDVICHRIWDTSIEKNTESLTKFYSYLKEQFDVPVFPVFGNHEPHPLNVWPGEDVDEFSVKWLFELAAEYWSDLIGQNVSETVLKGGYYSVSPRPGFRVIGINNNIGSTENYRLIFEDVDPFNQLQWLADTLKEAEDNNESVHILAHSPPSGSLLQVWDREFARIVQRFANTITGIFNGDSHKDEFHVFYNSSDSSQATVVAFNGASVTPFGSNNPSFKYYSVDDSTFNLLDYDEWYFNLSLANSLNQTDSIEWHKLYTFTEAYGSKNLLPSEIDKVLHRMTQDHSLLDDYFRFKARDSDAGTSGGCNDSCKKSLLCSIVTTVYGDDAQCNRFSDLYDQ